MIQLQQQKWEIILHDANNMETAVVNQLQGFILSPNPVL